MIARAALLLVAGCTLSTSMTSPSPSSPGPTRPITAAEDPRGTRTHIHGAPDEMPLPPGAIRHHRSKVDSRGFYLPVPERPVDPWAGVVDGKPITFVLDAFNWDEADGDVPCTAARDHCLPAASWMWFPEQKLHLPRAIAKAVVFTQEGPTRPSTTHSVPDEPYVAFRTVPVTRTTLVVGARVFAVPAKPVPASPWEDWHVGTVTSIDWDMGFVYLSTGTDPYFISAARVPVLRWDAAGGVQIVDGKRRDQLAVDVSSVILPD